MKPIALSIRAMRRAATESGYTDAHVPISETPPFAPGEVLRVQEAWRPTMYGYSSCIDYYERNGPHREIRGDDFAVMTEYIKVHKGNLSFPGSRQEYHSLDWHPAARMPEWAARYTATVLSVEAGEEFWTINLLLAARRPVEDPDGA